jgi:transcriptional regulator with XRE-family HTH domain
MIDRILRYEISKRELSNRGAARQIGIAHTTLERMLSGSPADLESIEKVSKWMHVKVSTLLDIEDENPTVAYISSLLDKRPEFRDALNMLIVGDDENVFSKLELFLEFMLYQNWLSTHKPLRGGVSDVENS